MLEGRLIVIEGSDGSGKQTQTGRLVNRARDNGYKVESLSFPDYESKFGIKINDYKEGKLGEDSVKIHPVLASPIYALDRLNKKETINNWLNNGINVILDRYVYSNTAHQACKLEGKEREEFIEWQLWMEFDFLNLPRPDLIAFLNVPPETTGYLMKDKEKDKHEENVPYTDKVYNMYKELAKGRDWVTIDCMYKNGILLSVETINDMIWDKVKGVLIK